MRALTMILGAMNAVLAASAAPLAQPGGEVDPALAAREVFQGPDYWWKRIEKAATPETSWILAILAAIRDLVVGLLRLIGRLIAAVLRALFGGSIGTASGGSSLVWLLAAALLAAAAWKLAPLILDRLGRARLPSHRPDDVEPLTLPAADQLRDQAALACREGRYAEAVRLALLALIAAFEKRGLLRYDTTRTNREYRAELRARPDLAEHFGRLARIYDHVWYGREPAGAEQAEESIRLCALMIDGEAASVG